MITRKFSRNNGPVPDFRLQNSGKRAFLIRTSGFHAPFYRGSGAAGKAQTT
ncbi:MAG: hypothetical protein OEW79_10425 [Betaproteobacteria bacterium]|jgi:hypothetical protein|nr:hypothetical protein [Betaproteobacteria bacterium]MDH4293484.1 hypothetical protein [Betaproteobacteria bacterium]MDH5343230.1 hypothetical protein [Betaproteobacteria bacterium]